MEKQEDGRIRKWTFVEEENKYLRVILLNDGETVHNAFFNRNFAKNNETMKIKYFPDTNTAFLEFSDQEVSETKELSEKIDVDIDGQDDLVSMTIEHDRKVPDFPICQWEKCKISLQF